MATLLANFRAATTEDCYELARLFRIASGGVADLVEDFDYAGGLTAFQADSPARMNAGDSLPAASAVAGRFGNREPRRKSHRSSSFRLAGGIWPVVSGATGKKFARQAVCMAGRT